MAEEGQFVGDVGRSSGEWKAVGRERAKGAQQQQPVDGLMQGRELH